MMETAELTHPATLVPEMHSSFTLINRQKSWVWLWSWPH